MRAVVIHETGGPEVLRLEDVPDPQPGDGAVLVRVGAIGVNPIEYKQRQGMIPKELPAILGSDISGTVEASNTDAFAVGDSVFGFAASGAYAELATSPAALLAKRPAAMSAVIAASIPVAGLTAWQALFDRGGLESGQTVLVAGAAGGVGHIAVQLAKQAMAHVIGTGSAANRDFVLGLGADEFVDYNTQFVLEPGFAVDLLFDTVGGDNAAALLPAVRDGGRVVTIAGAPPVEAAAERGITAELMIMSPSSEQLTRLAELIAGGKLEIEIAQTLALADVARAHELSETGHTRGKIVLEP